MSCNSCAKSFSLLRKEKGCPTCGFSYCSNCIQHKMFISNLNSEVKVCTKCKLMETSKDIKGVQPPDAYFKRLQNVESTSQGIVKPNKPIKNLDPKYEEIESRLQQLKQSNKHSVSETTEQKITERIQKLKGDIKTATEEELNDRLAVLKGVPSTSQSKDIILTKDIRTEQEQVEDLLKQYMKQTEIDANYESEFDEKLNIIQSRLQKLKAEEKPGSTLRSDNEEETIRNLIEKYKNEASLDTSLENTSEDQKNYELPFCEICNEDAKMRCLGCQYLFCKRCFLDHKDDDDGCDKYETYIPPKQNEDN